jgi:hypothetical protein
MLLDGDEAYTKAKEMLAKRFGDPFTVAASFRKRLEEWKQIAPGDAIGLRKYSDFLVQCETATEKVSSLNVLKSLGKSSLQIKRGEEEIPPVFGIRSIPGNRVKYCMRSS